MSSYKQLLFHSAAREKILRGATALTDAVRVTLGPKSKSVLIGKKWGSPIVCNDGVTIAKEFALKDPEENLGAQVIRQAAEQSWPTRSSPTGCETWPQGPALSISNAAWSAGLASPWTPFAACLARWQAERKRCRSPRSQRITMELSASRSRDSRF
jgi:hypothetical protein